MKHTLIAIGTLAALLLPSFAQTTGSIGLTNNYVARGTSQNYSGDPALMITLNHDFQSCFYAGVFAANVDFEEDKFGLQNNPTHTEISGWVGYRHKVQTLTLDYMLGSYNYLGDTFTSLDMWEFKVGASIPLGKATFAANIGFTPDYFNVLGESLWGDISLSYPITEKLTASVGIGRQSISDNGDNKEIPYNKDGYSYTTWNIGAIYTINKRWSLEARYYNTNRHDLGEFYTHNAYGHNVAVTLKFNF